MHIPLGLAILALMAFALLPVLVRSDASKINAPGLRAYYDRVARWVKE